MPEAEFIANLKKDGTTVDSNTYVTESSIDTGDLGEEISEEKVKKVSKRIAALSRNKIDELFYKLGFVVHEYSTRI